jgi:hypothetical protein
MKKNFNYGLIQVYVLRYNMFFTSTEVIGTNLEAPNSVRL